MADASLLGLLLRLGVSMGVVIGLMMLAARILRRSAGKMGIGGTPKARKTPINVAAMQAVTRGAHVAVVRAGGRELILGITEQQVTLLHSSIEPRDDVELLDGDSRTTTDSVDPDVASARIAPAAAASPKELVSGLSAWTDALETLREKTVRR